jgi:hypothetical protein
LKHDLQEQIQQRVGPTFRNKEALLDMIDQLPRGVEWKLEKLTLKGDEVDEDGDPMTEDLELWYRDPVECIAELMGNPMFKDVMRYSPEKVFEDPEGTKKIVNEMWTAEWWWKMQVLIVRSERHVKRLTEKQEILPCGATIAPVILSSDKTKLSQFRGDKSAWPVYLTIGNISKDVRRQASLHATVLIGYLPVGKFDCFTKNTRKVARYRTFHHCMSILTKSLVDVGKEGRNMTCADGFIRWIWPILAAYVADYPEQCLVACCKENRCPICNVSPDARGSHEPTPPRNLPVTIDLLAKRQGGCTDSAFKTEFENLGLRPVYPPFWARLPHSNIFQSFTPDLLHQIHKGVFKDHLVQWVTNLVGEKELDARFKSVPSHLGLRHFKNGISSVSQWTGGEHKAMEKVFLGLLIGSLDDRAIQAVRAALDFIYYSSLQSHTSATLAALSQSLTDFHTHRNVFIETGARNPPHFNVPKIHSIEHYVELIHRFGSADGFNTESPERLHIDYAKDAYRASNGRDYTIQMTNWLRRQEAVDRFSAYLEWSRNGGSKSDDATRPTSPVEHDDMGDEQEGVTRVMMEQRDVDKARAPTHKVAANHSQALRNLAASTIIENHNSPRFLQALHVFLTTHGCTLVPQAFDKFDLFRRLTIVLPKIPQASLTNLKNTVRASPPLKASGRRPAEPAHLDFALVRTGESNEKTKGTSLEGAGFHLLPAEPDQPSRTSGSSGSCHFCPTGHLLSAG